MLSYTKIFVIFILILSLLSCYSNKNNLNDSDKIRIENEILKVNNEIKQAAEKLDGEKIYSYVLDTEKGSLIRDGRIIMTRQMALDSYNRGIKNLTGVTYNLNKQYVTVISANTAFLITDGEYTGTTKYRNTFSSKFTQTVIFVLKDGKWKVLHTHSSTPRS